MLPDKQDMLRRKQLPEELRRGVEVGASLGLKAAMRSGVSAYAPRRCCLSSSSMHSARLAPHCRAASPWHAAGTPRQPPVPLTGTHRPLHRAHAHARSHHTAPRATSPPGSTTSLGTH